MEKLQVWLSNPLTAGPAAVAAGVALVALGSALSSVATGGGGRGSTPAIGRTAAPPMRSTVSGFQNTGNLDPQGTTVIRVNGSKVFFDLNDPIQQQNFSDMFKTAQGNRKIVLQRG